MGPDWKALGWRVLDWIGDIDAIWLLRGLLLALAALTLTVALARFHVPACQ